MVKSSPSSPARPIAQTLGLDRALVRERNLVPAAAMPYTTPLKSRSGSAIAYDTGDPQRA